MASGAPQLVGVAEVAQGAVAQRVVLLLPVLHRHAQPALGVHVQVGELAGLAHGEARLELLLPALALRPGSPAQPRCTPHTSADAPVDTLALTCVNACMYV